MRINGEYLPEGVGSDLNTQKVRNAIMIAYADDPTLMEMLNQYTYIEARCEALESSMKDMEFDWDSVELVRTAKNARLMSGSSPLKLALFGKRHIPVFSRMARHREWARPDLNRSQWLPKPQGYQATPRAH